MWIGTWKLNVAKSKYVPGQSRAEKWDGEAGKPWRAAA